MSRYSIQKKGCEYVVLVDDQSILTFTSRRKAAKFVAELRNCSRCNRLCRPGRSGDPINRL